MKRDKQHGLALPWERGGRRFLTTFSFRRSRTVLLVGSGVLMLWLFGRAMRDEAHKRETRLTIQETKAAMMQFQLDHERCPRGVHELMHPPGMSAPYLPSSPRDVWGTKLFVRCPQYFQPEPVEKGARVFVDVVSAGPSRSFFREDNITN